MLVTNTHAHTHLSICLQHQPQLWSVVLIHSWEITQNVGNEGVYSLSSLITSGSHDLYCSTSLNISFFIALLSSNLFSTSWRSDCGTHQVYHIVYIYYHQELTESSLPTSAVDSCCSSDAIFVLTCASLLCISSSFFLLCNTHTHARTRTQTHTHTHTQYSACYTWWTYCVECLTWESPEIVWCSYSIGVYEPIINQSL